MSQDLVLSLREHLPYNSVVLVRTEASHRRCGNQNISQSGRFRRAATHIRGEPCGHCGERFGPFHPRLPRTFGIRGGKSPLNLRFSGIPPYFRYCRAVTWAAVTSTFLHCPRPHCLVTVGNRKLVELTHQTPQEYGPACAFTTAG